jgi:hypothetical protein
MIIYVHVECSLRCVLPRVNYGILVVVFRFKAVGSPVV